MVESLEQLDPNCVIVFQNTEQNVTQLVSELNLKGMPVVTRPGSDKTSLFAFTRIDPTRYEDIHSCFHNLKATIPSIINIFPIYDNETTKRVDTLYKKNVKGQYLSLPMDADLIELFNLTGDAEQALYFSFFRHYIKWLLPMAFFGLFVRYTSGNNPWEFNPYYSGALLIWSITFSAFWIFKKKPYYNKIFIKSQTFSTLFSKQSTNFETPSNLLLKKIAFAPIAVVFALTLITCQLTCFAIEIFFTQLYAGPLASVTSLIPTVLLAVLTNIINMLYNKFFVERFIAWENGPNPKRSKMEKNFVLLFFVNYTPLLITLFLYLPFGYKFNSTIKTSVVSWANSHHLQTRNDDFKINTTRYKNQIFYFMVTNQIVAFALDNIVPTIIGKVMPIVQSKVAEKNEKRSSIANIDIVREEYPAELKRWKKVGSYSTGPWGEFDVDENYRKVIIQFGFVAMFSVLWPLAPSLSVFFNVLTYKADMWRALKKCKPKYLPILSEYLEEEEDAEKELSTDSWNVLLEIITWLSVIVGPTITYMYINCNIPGVGKETVLEKRDLWYASSPFSFSWTSLLLFSIFIEHVSIVGYIFISSFLQSTEAPHFRGFVPPAKSPREVKTMHKGSIDLSEVIEQTKTFKAMADVTPEPNESLPVPNVTDVFQSKNSDAKDKSVSPGVTDEIKDTTLNSIPTPSKQSTMKRDNESPATFSGSTSTNVPAIDDDSVAGATLPDTIPTSKNYDSRTNKTPSNTNKTSNMTPANGIAHDKNSMSINEKVKQSESSNSTMPQKENIDPTMVKSSNISGNLHSDVPLAAAAASTALYNVPVHANNDETERQAKTSLNANGIRHISSHRSLQPPAATRQFGRDYQPAAKPITPASRRYSRPDSRISNSGQNSMTSSNMSEAYSSDRAGVNRQSSTSNSSHKKKKGLLHKLKKKL